MEELLQIAINAAILAGQEILSIYDTDFVVQYKKDTSPLTKADSNANAIIMEFLEKTEIPIISEENKQTAYAIRKDWTRCWMVDPLDGTKEFINRNGEFTVNIALIENGTPILGVLYIPVTKLLYYTSATGGASYKTTIDSESFITVPEILKTSERLLGNSEKEQVFKITTSRSHLNSKTKQYIEVKKKQHPVTVITKGSSLKFCLLAEGSADVYPRFAPTMEWDTAAGHAICQAAGVSVLDFLTKEPLQYNKENLLNSFFIASTNNVHFE